MMKKSRENSFLLLTSLRERHESVWVWEMKMRERRIENPTVSQNEDKMRATCLKINREQKSDLSEQRQTEKYFVCERARSLYAHPLQIDSGIRAIMAMCCVFIYTYAHMHGSRYSAECISSGRQACRHTATHTNALIDTSVCMRYYNVYIVKILF